MLIEEVSEQGKMNRPVLHRINHEAKSQARGVMPKVRVRFKGLKGVAYAAKAAGLVPLPQLIGRAGTVAVYHGNACKSVGIAGDTCLLGREMAVKSIQTFEKDQKKGLAGLIQARKFCPADEDITYNLGLASGLCRASWRQSKVKF